jgi:hypothetical protein
MLLDFNIINGDNINKSIPLYSGGRCHRSESFKRGIKNSGMKGN